MNDKILTITFGTHFFKLTNIRPQAKEVILKFARKFIKYGFRKTKWGRMERFAESIYATATKDQTEFRFHINQYEDFKIELSKNFIDDNLIEFENLELNEPKELGCSARPTWVLRQEDQVPIFNYLLDETQTRSKLVGIQTGKGKTLISLITAATYNKRLMVVVRPMFIYKWIEDVNKYLDIKPEEIMTVQGSAELMGLLELQRQNKLDDIKVIILSNKTLQMWFKLFQEHGEAVLDLGYATTPENLYTYLNVGLRLIDEVHMDFHLNFKIDLYTNVHKSISLSATLDNKDPFIRSMYEVAYPIKYRFKEQEIDKYATATCVVYSIDELPGKIRTTEFGSKSYSHNAFEGYFFKKPHKLERYLKLIKYVCDVGFMQDYKQGEKLVIFAFKKEMCLAIAEYLKKAYPSLDIRRYVAEDPPENMYEPDIRVTTLGSGSTGHDISNLKAAIMTVNVDSLQANIQAFGRLRKLKDLTPRFFYFTCVDVPKHTQYHTAKMELLKQRASNFSIIQAPFSI
jgi:superfamily II DNA or RNA helicase